MEGTLFFCFQTLFQLPQALRGEDATDAIEALRCVLRARSRVRACVCAWRACLSPGCSTPAPSRPLSALACGLCRNDPSAHLLVNVVDEDRFRTSTKDGGIIGQVSATDGPLARLLSCPAAGARVGSSSRA